MHKSINKYFKEHPTYNSIVHVASGIGIGILLARPYVNHPVRVGLLLLLLSILGHLYPLLTKKKK